jgi:hypothetical protein
MSAPDLNQPLQLILNPDQEDRRVIVQFPQGLKGTAVFQDESKYLERSMAELGISVPPSMLEDYPELRETNRQKIYLEDSSFGKAFYEIYYTMKMDRSHFVWSKME